MDDLEILKYLGLVIEEENIIFYDDYSEEHHLKFDEVKELTIDVASTPIETKLSFWASHFLVYTRPLMSCCKPKAQDYRKIYELEIELENGFVLSRKVTDMDFYKIEACVNEINATLHN